MGIVSAVPDAEKAVVPGTLRAAVVVLGLEVLGLLAAVAVVIFKIITGDPDSLGRALLDAGWAAGGALVLGLCGWNLLRLKAAARAPALVLQILCVPVGYSLAFQASRPEYGGPILILALTTIYLLLTPQTREALGR